ncbi:hypothetical protein GCM10010112_66460 [Actinoplanes lobatus]|uniref:Uncharacterized protein n=1 Tax=Actinoplanes lobatus TaxID=113568 RepID=A0A7W7HIA0_9ACTN|nr:hypothetical protein [Actinoplanes lobatus]MBB4751026.1 hypothetical protein [Actinoplanes lobatus]GGN85722.1 hypothetical protein GCM10010112_66460 [Actinoplanes lobatus]GIE45699.1 hypothetical protein Alo02nite_85970 [Actinoplanes lobatus]
MDSEAVQVLTRWQDSGGTWRVLVRSDTHVTVALLTCTEEEVERCTWPSDPRLLALIS